MRRTNTCVWFSSFSLMALLPAIAGLVYADTVIDTTPSWNGSAPVFSFGPPDTETYGQTITVPLANSVLQSWTFYMELPTATQFQGEVYAWNGTMASGPNLFQSALMSTSNPSAFQPITFNTGGLALTPGDTYVLFASSSQGPQSPTGEGEWGFIPRGSVYAGGAFVFINNGANISQWTSSAWTTNWEGTGNDLAFKADFGSTSAVPEPSARILLATVLCAMVVLALRHRTLAH
jgi:hypothetical protein